jgi:ribulose-phosphate 3-epimerase
MTVRISPSILSADFANFDSELQRIAAADIIHVDVMDNHFVPNLTFGLPMVQRLQQVTPKPLDVHLMLEDPDRWAPGYAEAGAFSVTFHAEATGDAVGLARKLRDIGARAGLALKPGTAVDDYLEIAEEFDQILVMTVEPGFGGQSFMADMMPKLVALREVVNRTGLDIWLQVDGGITAETIGIAAEAGADTFVAGSAVFGADNVTDAINSLRAAAETHVHR